MALSVVGTDTYRLSREQFNRLRARAAKQGFVLHEQNIRTVEDAMEATLLAAPPTTPR